MNFIRWLAFSLTLFSVGVITGWWLHFHWPVSAFVDSGNHVQIEPKIEPQPFLELPPIEDVNRVSKRDQMEFQQCLEEKRYDDALIIYQSYENNNPALSETLRVLMLDKLDQLSSSKQYNEAIVLLSRFVDYYYQDIEWLKTLALAYEANNQLEQSIEISLNARTYITQPEQLDALNKLIHQRATHLYESGKKTQTLVLLIPLFQKLAWLEPEMAFYRFVLAESYIAANDNDSAINELELLQFDPELGNKANRLLTELLPPPPVESVNEPVNTVPLSGSGGHYIVNTLAGNKYDIRLLMDTGSSLTTFPTELISELRKRGQAMRIAHVELKTANGIRMAPVYRLKRFQIGNYTIRDLEVAELNLNNTNSEGLLGMNVLSQFHFFIDQNRKTLSLTPR